MCAAFSKPSCGLLVRERNGDSCLNLMATGLDFIHLRGITERLCQAL